MMRSQLDVCDVERAVVLVVSEGVRGRDVGAGVQMIALSEIRHHHSVRQELLGGVNPIPPVRDSRDNRAAELVDRPGDVRPSVCCDDRT